MLKRLLSRFWEYCSGNSVHGKMEFHQLPLWKNMFHGKIVCKYLRSDIWLFDKIVCFSAYKLEVLFLIEVAPT